MPPGLAGRLEVQYNMLRRGALDASEVHIGAQALLNLPECMALHDPSVRYKVVFSRIACLCHGIRC
jgi:hypothetical protein